MMQIALNTLGGLALFMLAMMMMTEGLKVFAGGSLKQLLNRYTSTPLRGVLAGVLVTGLVQSSGAVTVATIGFVNAGVFTLAQALTVVFGTNIGTTVTGWLVSLVGFGFKIENFALPILALGVALRLGVADKRLRGLGEALAGFGLFFLGLSILKDGFGGLAQSYSTALMDGERGGTLLFLILGFVATVLTQSSSASIAIVLTAVSGGVVGMYPAAVAIIGANLGSTSTAAMAVLRATPNAKRLALGHILFNLITGVVALALLPLLMWGIHLLADGLQLEGSPAAVLALFHTVFNVLGVLLMLPAAGLLTRWLQRLFRSQEEEAGRPRHLDATLTATPDLAESALAAELARLRLMANQTVYDALLRPEQPAALVEQQAAAMRTLVAAITDFISKVRAESMSREVGESLARDLRIARYLDEAARLSGNAVELRREMTTISDRPVIDILQQLIARVKICCELTGRDEDLAGADGHRQQALDGFQEAYQQAKGEILAAAVARRLPVAQAEQLLGVLSTTRRMVEQLVKADRLLRNPARAQAIEAQSEEDSSAE
ncbi:Na/Pi symporter [Desulfuromonas sp. KJ2020]|uniref:Na/Pi cotransporter family protein n=1 Tax=Desulfuromonas sp. KJ2020 TaxID=2919173 RepID=UPI0020A76539|nr:Na/Pi symporter [Desulfuromonas sp. KJ2020]MCP3176133.1 Na/Pi symporter [Desulfuromonas sp. KJ2020]